MNVIDNIFADQYIGKLFFEAVKSHCPFYSRVLDVGCGYGIATDYMRLLCKKMTLIDISPLAINYQLHHWQDDHNISIFCCTIKSIKEHYDLIYYFMSLHHISDIKAELTKIRELLTVDGELIICDILSAHTVPFHQNETVPFDGFTFKQLSEMLSENGFLITKRKKIAKLHKNHLDYDVFGVICKREKRDNMTP